MGTLTGVRDEVETRLREQFERILGRMNLVRREEFDAVQAMAAKARAEQEALAARVAALEARLVPVPRRGRGARARRRAGRRRSSRSDRRFSAFVDNSDACATPSALAGYILW